MINEALAVGTLSWYLTRLQVLYITSLATNYKQITKSLHEQGSKNHISFKNVYNIQPAISTKV